MQSGVPPSTAATTVNENSSADRFYDLSLRILMFVVSVALVGSVAFLTYRFISPPLPPRADVPVMEVGVKPLPAAAPAPVPAPKGEVLMAPGQIFKCDVGGRITFSEQPCSSGDKKADKNDKPR